MAAAGAVLACALALVLPASAGAAATTIMFDSGRLKLVGLASPIDIVDDGTPVELDTDIAPNGDFTVQQTDFALTPTSDEFVPGLIAAVDLTPLEDVTGNYNQATGQLTLDGADYSADVTLSGSVVGSCMVSPIPLAFSTENTTPFPGDRFAPGSLPPVSGTVVEDWSTLPAATGDIDCTSLIDSVSQGSGGLELSNTTAPPPPPPPPPPPVTPAAVPPPVVAQSIVVAPVSGTVLVKVPGGQFVPLGQLKNIPVGSIIDARKGRVRLTSAAEGGKTQTMEFYEGIFKVNQKRAAKPVTEAQLVGGDFSVCKRKAKRGGVLATAARSKRKVRRLWGSGKGRFRTRGKHSAGTVRGTTWLTQDRCDGTLTKVREGKVSVRDFRRKKTVTVKARHSYLAKAR